MGRQLNSLHKWEDLYSEQLENIRANPIRKSQTSRCKTSRTTTNAWVNQEKLLVARNQEWYQEVYSKIYQMPTEQSTVHEKSRRTPSIGNTRRTLVRNQHQHYRTFTKVKWAKCNSSHSRLVYEDN